ncbi:MAG: hypothetical protein RIS85_2251 [Pseudomonadota bacterium]|jgi:hypothetical protein
MSVMRAFLMQHRVLALLVVMAALCMKIVVPVGYMPGAGSKILTVQICADALGEHAVRQIVVPMKQSHGDEGAKAAKAECPFASLSLFSLAGADFALLIAALAFILALGFAPVRPPRPRRARYLRPPLRGPPVFA